MDVFAHADQATWSKGNGSFEELLTHYGCTIAELAGVLDIPQSQYIVAYRHCFDWWPVKCVEAIVEARQFYDDGLVELMTGKFGNHFFLYVFPRKKKREPRNYFSLQGNGIEY